MPLPRAGFLPSFSAGRVLFLVHHEQLRRVRLAPRHLEEALPDSIKVSMVQRTRPHLALGRLPPAPLAVLSAGEQPQVPHSATLRTRPEGSLRPQPLAQRLRVLGVVHVDRDHDVRHPAHSDRSTGADSRSPQDGVKLALSGHEQSGGLARGVPVAGVRGGDEPGPGRRGEERRVFRVLCCP